MWPGRRAVLVNLLASQLMNVVPTTLTDPAERWLSLTEAAPVLGLTPSGLKMRVRRGSVPTRKDNRGRLLVAVPASMLASQLTNTPTSPLMNTLASAVTDQLN